MGLLLARKSGWIWHSRAAGALGIATAIAIAPIWLVRPFAGVAAQVIDRSIATGAALPWAAASVGISLLVGIWALALSGRLPARPLGEGRLPLGWIRSLRNFALVGITFSLAASGGSILADHLELRPGVTPTGALVAQASDFQVGFTSCSTQSIQEYLSETRALTEPSNARPFADSWRQMVQGGAIEGSVGLLVMSSDQCQRVVDTDAWVESFVFRFSSSDDALKSYHAGLFGVVPNRDPAKEPHNSLPGLGWERDLKASWEEYAGRESESQYTAFWPYSNYLVFYVCRNVDPVGARPGTGGDYSVPPCASGAMRIQDRIRAGLD
jgi:hypothetical protein